MLKENRVISKITKEVNTTMQTIYSVKRKKD